MRTHIAPLAIALLFSWCLAPAASKYIRAGASGTGNGLSWANAYPSFAAAASAGYVRGDTYYIAGGNYNENVVIDCAPSGTTWLYLKKANAADNSGDAGWDPSYATTQAVINGWFRVDDGRISISGVTGSSPADNNYGIKIHSTATNTPVFANIISTGPYHVEYLEIRGNGDFLPDTTTALHFNAISTDSINGTRINNNWLHAVTLNGATLRGFHGTSYSDYGFLFENNWVTETGNCTDPGQHGQGLEIGYRTGSTYCIIRNNFFRDCAGTGTVVWMDGQVGATAIHTFQRVYNNVLWTTDPTTHTNSPSAMTGLDTQASQTDFEIYNNTFYNFNSSIAAANLYMLGALGVANNTAYNNIFESCRFNSGGHQGIATQSNNAYYLQFNDTISGTPGQVNGSSSTFMSAATGNFTLNLGGYAVGNGLDLSGTFTTDILGFTRTVPWDIGAYKYVPGAFIPSEQLRNPASFGAGSN